MIINLFGYNISLEIVILIVVIYLIMIVYSLYGCCNKNKPKLKMHKEGYEDFTQSLHDSGTADYADAVVGHEGYESGPDDDTHTEGYESGPDDTPEAEGFSGMNTNYGESANYKVGDYSQVDTSSWIQPNLLVTHNGPVSEGVNDILNRKSQPLPLPEGEMLMFADTPFRPECCPNTYSNSSGCACMSSEQVNFLKLRGMGNVPYSEY